MSIDKAGSPPCGIYVRIDDFSNMLNVIGQVRKLAFAVNRGSGYEKNMVVVELLYSKENEERLRDIIPIIQDNGMVAVVYKSHDSFGADGVLLDRVGDISSVRSALGDKAIIGLVCDGRSDAQNAIEQKADYVSLAADPSLISWFSAQSEIICLARGNHITNDNCGALAMAGAGIVDVSDYIWTHEKDIMQGTVNILHALDLAMKAPQHIN